MIKTYDVEELESILKVKAKTIRKYIVNGDLKAFSYGKNLVVTEDDLMEFLNNNRVYESEEDNKE